MKIQKRFFGFKRENTDDTFQIHRKFFDQRTLKTDFLFYFAKKLVIPFATFVFSSTLQTKTRCETIFYVAVSDSWTRYPTGVLVSTPHQMGVYAECVDVHRPIQGMYCLPDVLLKSTTDDDYMAGKPFTPAVNENAWREIFGVSFESIEHCV